jgi:1-pyrroline-5-carboxylate dehydrogenase
MWKTVGTNMGRYRNYPRSVGRDRRQGLSSWPTASADVDALAVGHRARGFEYQGQKCSAASRVYVPGVAVARREGARGRR